MPLTEPELHRLSRDTGVISRIAILIIGVAVVIAFVCSKQLASPLDAYLERLKSINGPLDQPDLPTPPERPPEITLDAGIEKNEWVVEIIRRALFQLRGRHDTYNWQAIRGDIIEKHTDDPDLQTLLMAYSRAALGGEAEVDELEWLKAEASKQPPPRFANACLGDIYQWEGDPDNALVHYDRETQFPRAAYAKRQVLRHHLAANDRDAVAQLIKDPRYSLDNAHDLLAMGVALKDPAFVLRGVINHDYHHIPLSVWGLAALVIILWFWILKKICFIPRWRSRAVAYACVAVVLGILSASATLFAVIWQDRVWGFTENGELWNDFVYFVVGVGVREETIKFLFILPLAPLLYHSRDPKTILFVCACVGLGFAGQENVHKEAAFGRFVSANFLHLALTGTLGYAFLRFLYTPKREWDRFLGTFVAVVVVHGCYDFLLSFFGQDGAFMAMVVFVGVAYFFLDEIAKHCPPIRDPLSPLAVFVVGGAALLGCALIASALAMGSFHQANVATFGQLLSAAPLLFLYVNRFRDA